MEYIGTHPLEGATLVASSDVTSNTASLTMTGIFDPEVMYFIHVMDYRPKLDERTLMYRWLDSSDNAISFTNIQESGLYGFSGGSGASGGVYSTNRTGGYTNFGSGTGNASDEHGMGQMWCVPNTANEKLAIVNAAFHNGTDEKYGGYFIQASRLNTSATRATGIEFVCDNNSGGHQINNVSIRVYKLGTKVNPIKTLKHRHTDNWVASNYIGGAIKGQGWVKVAEITAADGDSALDFTDVFTSNYKRYVITGTDCRPATDNTTLVFKYRDASGLNSGTYVSTWWDAFANGSTSTGHTDDNGLSSLVRNVGNTGNECGHFTGFLDPTNALTPKHLMYRSITQRADTYTRYQTGAIAYNDATVMTGINLYWSSGNWESGTVKIYGVND